MNIFQKWQDDDKDNSEIKRVVALVIAALIFPTGIPAILVLVLPRLDHLLGIGSFYVGYANLLIGVIAILIGGFFAFWTIIAQMTLASGTPLPMLPTKKLLIRGPFHYCRNPMTLGTILAYSGFAIAVGSYAALGAVLIIALLLLTYIKLIEEKELEMRFGQDYVAYKNQTPFLLPIRFSQANQNPKQEK